MFFINIFLNKIVIIIICCFLSESVKLLGYSGLKILGY